MKKTILYFLTFTSLIILTECAATYRPINPPTVKYNSHDLQDGIGLSYKYGILQERGNRKYAKKETKKGIKLIAVKVTNNTEKVINVGKDVAFYSGQNQIFLLKPILIKETIKQFVPGYLPYLLLTFIKLNVSNGNSTETYSIGYGLGPGITIGNMAIAGTANKKMLDELFEYNIMNKDIQKGETIYGIIGVPDMGYSPITIKMIK